MPTVKECTILAEKLESIRLNGNQHYEEVTLSMQEMKDDLSNHIILSSVREDELSNRYELFSQNQAKQSEAIESLSKSSKSATESVEQLVDILTTGRTLGRLGKWLAGMAGFWILWDWITKYWDGNL